MNIFKQSSRSIFSKRSYRISGAGSCPCSFSVHWPIGFFQKIAVFLCALVLVLIPIASVFGEETGEEASVLMEAPSSTTDHKSLPQLQGPFSSGSEVTKACIGCHTKVPSQLMKTTHWNWRFEKKSNPNHILGKQYIFNAFCGSPQTNWKQCTICHIGYGWKDPAVTEPSETQIDCLVCHEGTGQYKKYSYGYAELKLDGVVVIAPDYIKLAQSVRLPTRRNCGVCHFYGGAHDGAKHGDLDSSLLNPNQNLDVHMAKDGVNFSCITCHTADAHQFSGSHYLLKAVDLLGIDLPGHTDHTRTSCESCHGLLPHKNHSKLNDHTDRVACQTCHIPLIARGGVKTKIRWDWSTAGKPGYTEKQDINVTYSREHGTILWGENLKPSYFWFDGDMDYLKPTDKINDTDTVYINTISGDYNNPKARIWPFKLMKSRQPYDIVNKHMVITHTVPYDANDHDAFYRSFNWDRAIKVGMKAENAPPYSGKYGFVETAMLFPITHMVAPKKAALTCNECHCINGRLSNLSGFYMPGRDTFPMLNVFGWGAVLLSLVAVIFHGALRIIVLKSHRGND